MPGTIIGETQRASGIWKERFNRVSDMVNSGAVRSQWWQTGKSLITVKTCKVLVNSHHGGVVDIWIRLSSGNLKHVTKVLMLQNNVLMPNTWIIVRVWEVSQSWKLGCQPSEIMVNQPKPWMYIVSFTEINFGGSLKKGMFITYGTKKCCGSLEKDS